MELSVAGSQTPLPILKMEVRFDKNLAIKLEKQTINSLRKGGSEIV